MLEAMIVPILKMKTNKTFKKLVYFKLWKPQINEHQLVKIKIRKLTLQIVEEQEIEVSLFERKGEE